VKSSYISHSISVFIFYIIIPLLQFTMDDIKLDHDNNSLTFVSSKLVKRYGNVIKGYFVGLFCVALRHVKIASVVLGAVSKIMIRSNKLGTPRNSVMVLCSLSTEWVPVNRMLINLWFV
jgi:hypothetical protein